MGTKTTHLGVQSYNRKVKKESPNMGTKTWHNLLPPLSFCQSEKRIPKHGDENFCPDVIRKSGKGVKKESPNMGTKTWGS